MITHKDQLSLFQLMSNTIKKDVTCYAFGGTAMMFYGYKEETKDVDLLFELEEEREEFIRALHLLGYTETTSKLLYSLEKLQDKHKPLMFKREDSRFDLFVKQIFKTLLSEKIKQDIFAVHEFKGKATLTVKVVRKECIVLLKAVTDRDKDFEDILTIVQRDQHFDWQYLIDEVIWQYQHGDSWVLLDMEETLKELKQYIFIGEKYLKQLYAVVKNK